MECLRSVAPDLHDDILDNLHKLSFTSMAEASEAGGTKHHFTAGGRLVRMMMMMMMMMIIMMMMMLIIISIN